MVTKRKNIFVIGLAFVLALFIGSLTAHQLAFADYDATNGKCNGTDTVYDTTDPLTKQPKKMCKPADATATPGSTVQQDASKTGTATCAITKIGWILCPIITEAGHISDSAFSMLANNFLQTEPELIGTSSNGASPTGTMFAWEQARNLANILFIIAFLIIIISQVTGYGVSNYGIKKMIPRLVVAAIAVNLSYYVCQIIVDLTNILGFAIENMLVDAGNSISSQSVMPIKGDGSAFDGSDGDGFLSTVALIAVAGGAVYILLPLLFGSLGMVLFTCIAVIFILLMRKAIIVLLVVASPIAFVAYLLPNTEKLFSKWLHMFWQLLLVFPIVGMLLGGGQLASKIILTAGAQQTQAAAANNPNSQQCVTIAPSGQATQGTCQKGSATISLGLIAAGVAVAPLLATYAVLKGAISSAGAIGGKISGAVQGASGKLGGWSQGKLDKTAFGRGVAARQTIKENYSNQQFAKRMAGGKGLRARYTRAASRGIGGNIGAAANWANEEIGDTHPFIAKGMNAMTGSVRAQDAKLTGQFADAAEKIQQQDLQAAGLKVRDLDNAKLKATVDGSNDVNDPTVAAAIRELIKRQDFEGIEKALDKFGNKQGLASRVMGSDLESTGLLTGGQLGDISRGAMADSAASYKSMVMSNIENGILTPEKIATTGPGILAHASDLAETSARAQAALKSAATIARNDDVLKVKIGRNSGQLAAFESGVAAGSKAWR